MDEPYNNSDIATIYQWVIHPRFPQKIRVPIIVSAYLYKDGTYQYAYKTIGTSEIRYARPNDGKYPDLFRDTAVIVKSIEN